MSGLTNGFAFAFSFAAALVSRRGIADMGPSRIWALTPSPGQNPNPNPSPGPTPTPDPMDEGPSPVRGEGTSDVGEGGSMDPGTGEGLGESAGSGVGSGAAPGGDPDLSQPGTGSNTYFATARPPGPGTRPLLVPRADRRGAFSFALCIDSASETRHHLYSPSYGILPHARLRPRCRPAEKTSPVPDLRMS